MELLVVGAGAVGRWFGRTVDADIVFTDVDPVVAERAAEAVGGWTTDLDARESFSAVVIAVPLPATPDAIATHAGRAERAMLDLSGAMAAPVSAMAEHAPALERASLHPLFAPENAPGRVALVADGPGPTIDAVRADLTAAGNELFETTADAHDRAMETVQVKAHTAVLAFALAADDIDSAFGTPVYERLAELVEEVTGGEPRVYADIQAAFDGAAEVADVARSLADADHETFERLYRDAGA